MSGVAATAYVMRLRLRTPAHKLVLLALASRCDEAYSCYPSRGLIAAEALISPERAKTLLRELRRDGYVSARERRRGNRSKTSNRYYVHGPWDGWDGRGTPFEEIDRPGGKEDRYAAVHDGAFHPGVRAGAGGVVDNPSRTTGDSDIAAAGAGVAGDPWEGSAATPSVGITGDPSRTDHEEPTRRTGRTDVRRTAADGYSTGSGTSGGGRGGAVRVRPRRRPPGFEEVAAALPCAVRPAPGRRLAPALVRAICEALAGVPGAVPGSYRLPPRTAEQLIARINRRWHRAGGDERSRPDYRGDDRIRRPVGYVAELLTAQECPDPSCEDGQLLASGAACGACRERRADQQAAKRAFSGLAARLDASPTAPPEEGAAAGTDPEGREVA